MEKLITILFDSEELAIKASEAMQQLAINKDIAIIELYMLSKNDQGNITVKDEQYNEIQYSGTHSLPGKIIWILGGPVNVLTGLTKRSFAKKIGLEDYGKALKVLNRSSKTLAIGKVIIVAHISESWEIPLDLTLEPFNVSISRWTITEETNRLISERQKEIEGKQTTGKSANP